MNWIRKGTMAALVVGLILGAVSLAYANYVIRQNSDGTTDWVDESARAPGWNPEVRVGRQHFVLRITDANNPLTYYFISPISGVLYSAFAVQNSNPVAAITTNLTFGIMARLTPLNFIHPTTGGWISLRPTTQIGTVFYTWPQTAGARHTRNPQEVTKMEGNTAIAQGGIISIASGGEATDPGLGGGGSGEYDIFIIIDPR